MHRLTDWLARVLLAAAGGRGSATTSGMVPVLEEGAEEEVKAEGSAQGASWAYPHDGARDASPKQLLVPRQDSGSSAVAMVTSITGAAGVEAAEADTSSLGAAPVWNSSCVPAFCRPGLP